MGTGNSSNTTEEDDVRNRLNSGDFQKISPPSSPSIEAAKVDEMSYSGILVEKPGTETPTTPAAAAAALPSVSSPSIGGASFAADLTTPPVSNRSKNRNKTAAAAASSKEQPRRIVKATPPPSSSEVVVADTMGSNRNDNDVDSPAGVLHAHASPIGANAATEMLEESIEKNASKNKRMERVTNKQKSDREKLLQEKRRRQQPTSDKPEVQANPFSRFLRAFSVDANPTHKRKESTDAGDPNKRLKFGFNDDNQATKPSSASSTSENEEQESEESPSYYYSPWIAAASVATIAVLVVAIVRGGKKKY